jgi:hypothetical protein
VADAESNYPGMLWNLSVAGAYVEMQPPLVEAGQEVTLSFCLPGELTVIRVTAKVAWINPPGRRRKSVGDRATQLPPGFGLEFTNLAQIDRTRITARVQGM